MNFDEIENLSEENVNEYYDDILSIAELYTAWYVSFTNGRTGYFAEAGDHYWYIGWEQYVNDQPRAGYDSYGRAICWSPYNGPLCNICGPFEYGYSIVIGY